MALTSKGGAEEKAHLFFYRLVFSGVGPIDPAITYIFVPSLHNRAFQRADLEKGLPSFSLSGSASENASSITREREDGC